MIKYYEEPEFKVITVNCQDVITYSQEGLETGGSGWESGGVPFEGL